MIKIAFIDDNAVFCDCVQELVKDTFENQVIIKTFVTDEEIENSISWIVKNKPQLVFLDYILDKKEQDPTVSLNIYHELVRNNMPCEVVFFMTGLFEEDVRRELLKDSKIVCTILSKPLGWTQISEIIQKCLIYFEKVEIKEDVK